MTLFSLPGGMGKNAQWIEDIYFFIAKKKLLKCTLRVYNEKFLPNGKDFPTTTTWKTRECRTLRKHHFKITGKGMYLGISLSDNCLPELTNICLDQKITQNISWSMVIHFKESIKPSSSVLRPASMNLSTRLKNQPLEPTYALDLLNELSSWSSSTSYDSINQVEAKR